MIIVNQILQWARDNGYTAVYGSAEQVNEMLTSVPFANSKDGTVVVMHLIAASETVDGHDRATLAVSFASLCPFDFDGESLLPEQERLKNVGKALLNDIRTGNVLSYADPRWQYGYDDYAENVAWVCLRVTLTSLAAECVPMELPDEDPVRPIIGLPSAFLVIMEEAQQPRDICSLASTSDQNDTVAVAWVSRSSMTSPSVTINDTTITADNISYGVVDSSMAEGMPVLLPYIGWTVYLTILMETGLDEGDNVNVTIYDDGEEILDCSGVVPEI